MTDERRTARVGRRRRDRWLFAATSWKNLLVVPAAVLLALAVIALVPRSPKIVLPATPTTTSFIDRAQLEARIAALEV